MTMLAEISMGGLSVGGLSVGGLSVGGLSVGGLSAETTALLLLTLHTVIGLTGAWVAYRKGRSLPLWLFIGILGGTPALITALILKPQPR